MTAATIRLAVGLLALAAGSAARAGATFPPANGTGLSVTLPNGVVTTIDAALDPRNYTQLERAVGTRLGPPVLYSQQTLTVGQSRIYDQLTSRGAPNCIRLKYPNWLGNSGTGESASPGPITISASVEVSTTNAAGATWSSSDGTIVPLQVTFNGAKYVTIPVDGTATSDPVCYPFFPGQSLYYRTTFAAAGGAAVTMPTNHFTDGTKSEITSDGFWINTALGSSATATTTPSGTVDATKALPPYRPGSLAISGSGFSGTDNGSGAITGTGITSGSINYTTGAIALTLSGAAVAPNAITIGSVQGQWGTALTDNTMTAGQLTTAMGWVSWNGHYTYGPSEVVGTFAPSALVPPRSVLIAGDSRLQGFGSTSNQYGWIERALNGQAGIIKLAVQGELANGCASLTAFRRRYNLAPVADRAFLNYGVNDFASRTVAQTEADETTCAQRIAALLPRGIKDLYAIAVEPRTTSATVNTPFDAPNYGSGSVAGGSPSKRNAYNAWLYSQVGVLWAGVIDTNAIVENSPATQAGAGDGTWKSLANTKDGLHLNETGYALVGSTLQGTAPFVFP